MSDEHLWSLRSKYLDLEQQLAAKDAERDNMLARIKDLKEEREFWHDNCDAYAQQLAAKDARIAELEVRIADPTGRYEKG